MVVGAPGDGGELHVMSRRVCLWCGCWRSVGFRDVRARMLSMADVTVVGLKLGFRDDGARGRGCGSVTILCYAMMCECWRGVSNVGFGSPGC